LRIQLTPKEFRGLLSSDMQEMFDQLVKIMTEYGVDEDQAQAEVARQLFKAVTEKEKLKAI
jgi:hypothetical protein